MGTLANSEDPDEMHAAVYGGISSGSTLFAKIKTIFRDRNTAFYRNLTGNPLKYKMDYSILIVSTCMG